PTFAGDLLAPLKDLWRILARLNLRGLDVTDEHLVHLKDLTNLTWLHLRNTKITDKGLEQLEGLTNLEYLNLHGDDVTDAGLVHLEGLKNLRHIYLSRTKVTEAGAARLKKALPRCEIDLGAEPGKPPEASPSKPGP